MQSILTRHNLLCVGNAAVRVNDNVLSYIFSGRFSFFITSTYVSDDDTEHAGNKNQSTKFKWKLAKNCIKSNF